MLDRRLRVALAVAALGLVVGPSPAVAVPCPATGAITVVAEGQGAAGTVTVTVAGELLDAGATCDGAGDTTYTATLTCTGPGPVRCGRIDGLRPGTWVHRVRVTVGGSSPQEQSQRGVVVASAAGALVSNVVAWTVHPRTFVVTEVDDGDLLAQLDAAAGYTASHPAGTALVRFDPLAFPGAADPRVIDVSFTEGHGGAGNSCGPRQLCPADSRLTTICFTGSRIVVDALDRLGAPGGVILRTGTCESSLLRLYGSDNVLRGLELRGSEKPPPAIVVDTIAITGAAARRNRLEQMTIRGPTMGDAVSVEAGAGGADDAGDGHTVIVDSEILDAEDKGIKATTQGHVLVADSCVHDNRNGGIQSTLGGHVVAMRNVVQRNVPGAAENGLSVGVPTDAGAQSTLATDGNLVRFAGARGISVVNAAAAVLRNDVLVENQVAGLRIETTMSDVRPLAAVRGVTAACNHKGVTGTCVAEPGSRCTRHADCAIACTFATPDGFGAVVAGCGAPCRLPDADLGMSEVDPGRNAFTLNPRAGQAGVNVVNALPATPVVAAFGNQWEHCGSGATCDANAVSTADVSPTPAAVTVGTPAGPGAGAAPVITSVWPPRPRKDALVRIYNGSLDGRGGPFDAIAGTVCTPPTIVGGRPAGIPADGCSVDATAVVVRNQAADGHHVAIAIGGQALIADVHAVTPGMLIVRMPVDCFAPATLTVERNGITSAPVVVCDPGGCAGRAAGALCDDDDVCTLDDQCDGAGACVPGPSLGCDGGCLTGTCDPEVGCLPASNGSRCDDGDACTSGDTCDADGTCRPGTPVSCADDQVCTTDTCDPLVGCRVIALRDGTACGTTDACHAPSTCRSGACAPGTGLTCDDGDRCTGDACDPQVGCRFVAAMGVAAVVCRVDGMRALMEPGPDGSGRLRARLDRLAAALARAEATPARRRRELRRAKRLLRSVTAAIRGGERRLGEALATTLRDAADAARTALRAVD